MNPEAKTSAGDPPHVVPSRHIGTTVVLFLMSGFFWLVLAVYRSPETFLWYETQYPDGRPAGQMFIGGIAVVVLAGALALPTRTTLGLWLGRVAGAVLVGLAVYWAWLVFFVKHDPISDRHPALDFMLVVPVVMLFAGPGLGVLVALRQRREDPVPPQD